MKLSICDIIAWIVVAGILVWLLLKTFGIINTSIWLEYAPIYGAVYLVGWHIHKLGVVARKADEISKFKDATIKSKRS